MTGMPQTTANVPGVRWWPLYAVAAAVLASLAWFWLGADTTRSYRVLYSGLTALVGIIGVLLWLAFGSGMPVRKRRIVMAVIVVPLATLAVLFRIEKVTGDMVPILTWRFGAKSHERLARQESATTKAEATIELKTSPWDYPQFMGPRRDATLQGVDLETDWEVHPPRQLWRQPIGAGWSSFSVVGELAFTQEQRGPQELVTCYELKTGKLCWSHADEAYFESKIAGDGPRGTPTVVDGRVYTMGATGLLNCLDAATGARHWQRNALDDTSPQNADWGKACSPLVIDGLVIVTGGAKGPTLVAYRADDGELVWKADDEPTAKQAYSSPMICELAGVRQVVMLNDNTIAGYEPATGKQLWHHPWPGTEPKVTQPLVIGDNRLLVGSGYGVGCALLQLNNKDGHLKVEELWMSRQLEPKFTNVVYKDGYFYGLDEGIFVCLDPETGKRRWKKGRYGHGQIMLIDDVILVLAENGDAVLVEANSKALHELSRFPVLEGKSWSHPVVVPPYLLVRNDTEARCYELPLK